MKGDYHDLMTWEEVCTHPSLRDIPFKVELDRYGNVLMSPVGHRHARQAGKIVSLLTSMLPGWAVLVEGAVEASPETRAPDVSAITAERYRRMKHRRFSLNEAPDICVEVLSASNPDEEMEYKQRFFGARGCREFWTCAEDGRMTFYDAATGAVLERSRICPDFPIEIVFEDD